MTAVVRCEGSMSVVCNYDSKHLHDEPQRQ